MGIRVDANHLRELISALFQKLGQSKEDADITADVLLVSDLFGVDSCTKNGQHHAYAQPENDADRVVPFRVSPTDHPELGRIFHVDGVERLVRNAWLKDKTPEEFNHSVRWISGGRKTSGFFGGSKSCSPNSGMGKSLG